MTRISNRPLPDGHPFKGGRIIFGSNIPEAWKEGFRKKAQGLNPVQPSTPEGGQPSGMPDPDDLEAQAFNDFDDCRAGMICKKAEKEK